jgi:hypothetical protein
MVPCAAGYIPVYCGIAASTLSALSGMNELGSCGATTSEHPLDDFQHKIGGIEGRKVATASAD